MRLALVYLLSFIFITGFGQGLQREEIVELADQYFIEGITTLRDFLKLSNWGGSTTDIDQNLTWCETEFHALEFRTSTLLSMGIKHLLAERIFDETSPTVLFYLQIDGMPVDSAEWDQESPYLPILKECKGGNCVELDWNDLEKDWNPDWKIFARSASDSKGPAIAFLQALRILHQKDIQPPFNIKVIMDFQEELGSPSLPSLVELNREKFEADVMLIMDGTRPPGNLPTLTFGARGIATLKLTVFGPKTNLHSGQYGNFAPNPVFTLAHLLASMKDEDGRVLIPGYYDGVKLSERKKKIINQVPEDRDKLIESLGIYEPDMIGETYQESLQYPSFNVRGLRAAWVDEEVRTIIPSEALAEIDMRLVPETEAERQIQLVKDHIQAQGFKILNADPTDTERKNSRFSCG